MDPKNCPLESCRWETYRTYKFILWAWMLNEISVVFSPVEISYDGFYAISIVQLMAVILIGIPLVYSEICIAQYTNCNIVSMWNFLPVFRSVGYGTFYFIILKTIYVMVLTSWYLDYTFYSARDPPPWFTCDDFNSTSCMIKRINISVFQRCIEAEYIYEKDCAMKTGSNCFFQREIGDINTKNFNYIYLSKGIIASVTTGLVLFILSIKREKFIQSVVKLLVIYVCIVVFILLWVILSSSGTWYASKITMNWYVLDFEGSMFASCRGILTCGVGSGIIVFISRDVSFRSPATMTSVTVSSCSTFVSILLALVIFNGIKTMSYYHGDEENVLEIGDNFFFTEFVSTTEALMYFDQMPVWTFLWLSAICFCLFVNLWILCTFLQESMFNTVRLARKYERLASALLIVILCILSLPFFCSDLAAVLNNVVEILQLTNILFFTIAVYWVYGFKSHSVDIIFMIGVKPSLYWKMAWVSSPVMIFFVLFFKWQNIFIDEYDNSYFIESISIYCDTLLLYILISGYFLVTFVHMLLQLRIYYYYDHLRNLFCPAANWGPRDKTLFRSRSMFVPEIMTREFLYRQVRIRGYSKNKPKFEYKKDGKENSSTSLNQDIEWNALTSN